MSEELSNVKKEIAEKEEEIWESFRASVKKMEPIVKEIQDFWVDYKRIQLATTLGSTRYSWWLARNIPRYILPVPKLLPEIKKEEKLAVIDFLPEKGTYCMKCGHHFKLRGAQMTYVPEKKMLRCRCWDCDYTWLSHTKDKLMGAPD